MDEGFPSTGACRIVGVTPRQIQYWDEIGLVKPSARPAAGRGSRRRYSFLDLVRLSVVRALIERGLQPQKIRKSLAALREAYPEVLDPLGEQKLVTDGERLFLVTADRRRILDVLERQFVFSIALGPLVRRLRGRIARLPAGARGPVRPAAARPARRAPAGWEGRVGA
ncbi:MAG: MerR family transcriptional regulator [Deltaproteobacteria bacterium]|nr:MerR family transcriptional regulator [Deltaproteobacteria bacterium]